MELAISVIALQIDVFLRCNAESLSHHLVHTSSSQIVVQILLSLPSSRLKLSRELGSAQTMLQTKLAPPQLSSGATYESSLPTQGYSISHLDSELDMLKGLEKGDVTAGRVSGAVYHGGKDIEDVIMNAMGRFIVSNPLHPDLFPAIRKMESEIVSMCLTLFSNPPSPPTSLLPLGGGAGTTTSGGTESILMAIKTYRDWGRKTKGIKRPEMVIPSSAHAAFWKGGEYFGVKVRVVDVDPVTRKADVKGMARAM